MAKKRKSKQKSKKKLILFVLSLSFMVGIYFSLNSIGSFFSKLLMLPSNIPGFEIKTISISGANAKTSNLIRKNLKISENENIFKLSTEEIYKNIREISWVKFAIVRKNLPNGLNIKITEAVPIAVFQQKSQSTLIDSDGVFIENIKAKPLGLPLVSGINSNKNVKSILDLISNFDDIKNNLESLSFIRERRWDISVSGIKIKLPEKNMEKALEIFSIIMKSGKINKNTARIVDLRVPENVIINGLRLKREANV